MTASKSDQSTLSPSNKIVPRTKLQRPYILCDRLKSVWLGFVSFLRLRFLNRLTTKDLVKFGIFLTCIFGIFQWIENRKQAVFFQETAYHLEALNERLSDITKELVSQRRILTVYAESTQEQALMSHVISMMRSNRVALETTIDP